jgi:hypothetical protein
MLAQISMLLLVISTNALNITINNVDYEVHERLNILPNTFLASTVSIEAYSERVATGAFLYPELKDGKCGGKLTRIESTENHEFKPPIGIACVVVFPIAP